MEYNQSSDFTPAAGSATTGENVYSDTGATGGKQNIDQIKEKASQQAVALKERVSEKAKIYGDQVKQKADQARGKASVGLRSTSQRMQNIAQYLEEHDANEMSQAALRSSKEYVRQNPGKSLLIGLGIGMLLGRVFSLGGGRHQR